MGRAHGRRWIARFIGILLISAAAPARAPADDVYVGIYSSGVIDRISPNGTVTPFATVATTPTGMAFDSAGNLFVATYGAGLRNHSNIYRISPSGSVTTLVTGLNALTGLAFDASGILYASSEGGPSIQKITPSGVVSFFANMPDDAEGLCFDSAGNCYCALLNYHGIQKITPAGVTSAYLTINSPLSGLAIDRSTGTIYASNGDDAVLKIAPGAGGVAGSVSTFATGFHESIDIDFDSQQNLYVTNSINPGSLSKVTPAGVVTTLASGLGEVYGIAVQVPEPATATMIAWFGGCAWFACRMRQGR